MVESIIPIYDELVSDYSGKNQGFALSVRFSVGQVGMIVIVLVCPALYNMRHSLADPFWFMLAFAGFGFVMTIVVVIIDRRGQRTARGSSRT